MQLSNKKKIFLGLFLVAIFLSACVYPEKEDPFLRLPEEQTESLEGTLFPFSVSVSTKATHRLEDDGKLVAYLASHIVRLSDFEGHRVEVQGTRKTEKMREIFWVERIKLKDLPTETEVLQDQRFSTNRFSFLYSGNWEYSTSPSGVVHFLEKTDPARRVFLMFSVEDIEREDKKVDPNVLISNLAGTKKVTTDNLDRERQEIVLFSNLYDVKYRLIFTSSFEEFEKKKAFFTLLNSFVEGEEAVQQTLEDDKKQLALQEAEKIKDLPKEETEEATPQKSLLEKIFGDTSEESVAEEEVSSEEALQQVATPLKGENITVPEGEFLNLIEEHAFPYESQYYGFKMSVPWGFWFRNFGPSENLLARIGFSDEDFSTLSGAKFWLEILGDENPATEFSEVLENGQIVIDFPRSEKSFFRLHGPAEFRDAMRSIHATIEKF